MSVERPHSQGGITRRPVMMMTSGELADEVVRLAAAAGCEPDRVSDPEGLRQRWTTAPLLLLDVQAAMATANAGLPRRDGVVIVSPVPDPEVWRCAVAVGAEHVAVLSAAEAWLDAAVGDAAG